MASTDSQHTHFEETSFWQKIGRFALRAGRSVIEKALILYFCMRDPDTPRWARGVIVGALVYFVLPVDAVPDFLPGIGFADDLGVLVTALATVLAHVKPGHRERARELFDWRWASRSASDRGDDTNRDNYNPGRQTPPEADSAVRYCAVLGVGPDASPEDVRARYLDCVKKYHPDRVQHLGAEFQEMAEQKMKEINAAYTYFTNRN